MNTANVWLTKGQTKRTRFETCKIDTVIFSNKLNAYCEECYPPHEFELKHDDKIAVNNAINKFILDILPSFKSLIGLKMFDIFDWEDKSINTCKNNLRKIREKICKNVVQNVKYYRKYREDIYGNRKGIECVNQNYIILQTKYLNVNNNISRDMSINVKKSAAVRPFTMREQLGFKAMLNMHDKSIEELQWWLQYMTDKPIYIKPKPFYTYEYGKMSIQDILIMSIIRRSYISLNTNKFKFKCRILECVCDNVHYMQLYCPCQRGFINEDCIITTSNELIRGFGNKTICNLCNAFKTSAWNDTDHLKIRGHFITCDKIFFSNIRPLHFD